MARVFNLRNVFELIDNTLNDDTTMFIQCYFDWKEFYLFCRSLEWYCHPLVCNIFEYYTTFQDQFQDPICLIWKILISETTNGNWWKWSFRCAGLGSHPDCGDWSACRFVPLPRGEGMELTCFLRWRKVGLHGWCRTFVRRIILPHRCHQLASVGLFAIVSVFRL